MLVGKISAENEVIQDYRRDPPPGGSIQRVIFPGLVEKARLDADGKALAIFLDEQGNDAALNARLRSAPETIEIKQPSQAGQIGGLILHRVFLWDFAYTGIPKQLRGDAAIEPP